MGSSYFILFAAAAAAADDDDHDHDHDMLVSLPLPPFAPPLPRLSTLALPKSSRSLSSSSSASLSSSLSCSRAPQPTQPLLTPNIPNNPAVGASRLLCTAIGVRHGQRGTGCIGIVGGAPSETLTQ